MVKHIAIINYSRVDTFRKACYIVIVDVNSSHKPVDARSVRGCTQPSMQWREVPTERLAIRLIGPIQLSFL
jgi:hypothetical protein